MRLSDSELEILWLLKGGKLRWGELVEKSQYSRRWVHKSMQKLMERSYITREEEKEGAEYPKPVYYSIARVPPEVEDQIRLFEVFKPFLEPIEQTEKKLGEIGSSLTSSKPSLQEFSDSIDSTEKMLTEMLKSFEQLREDLKPLMKDLREAIESGELPRETIEAPLYQAAMAFLKYKVKKGELPRIVLSFPLREAIREYRHLRK